MLDGSTAAQSRCASVDPERVHARDLRAWFAAECATISNAKAREVVISVGQDLEAFVRFPQEALLLWRGCIRPNNRTTHRYPDVLKTGAKERLVKALDSRANGPAIAAFRFAGGADLTPVRWTPRMELSCSQGHLRCR